MGLKHHCIGGVTSTPSLTADEGVNRYNIERERSFLFSHIDIDRHAECKLKLRHRRTTRHTERREGGGSQNLRSAIRDSLGVRSQSWCLLGGERWDQ